MIHLSRFYTVDEISTPAELYYVAELSRYLGLMSNETLSMEGILIPQEFKNCNYYKYLTTLQIEGVEYVPENEGTFGRMFTGDFSSVNLAYAEQNHHLWVLDFNTQSNYDYFNGALTVQCWVSYVAYIHVHKMLKGYPQKLELDLRNALVCISNKSWRIIDLYCVLQRTSALNDWLKITLNSESTAYPQIKYEAARRESELISGEVSNFIPNAKKYKYIKNNYKVGDIVYVYQKSEKGNESDTIRSIESCNIAEIVEINSKAIVLNVFLGLSDTELGRRKEIESLTYEARKLYTEEDMKRVNVTKRNYPIENIGVDDYISMEEYFITDLLVDDYKDVWCKFGSEEVLLHLVSEDAVYAILDQRNIDFNRDQFEERYFKDNESLYISTKYGL